MDNHDESRVENWVDEEMSTLRPGPEWEPSSEMALSRLRQRERRVAVYRRVAGVMTICGLLISVLVFTSTRTRTEARLDIAPNFELENIKGGKTTAADIQGNIVVVDLWATWCQPCLDEIPGFNKLQADYAGCGVSVVGIAVESPYKDIATKVREHGIKYRVLVGNDGVVDGFGGITGFPTTFLINRDWKIYKSYIGLLPNKHQIIGQDIDRLLEGTRGSCAPLL